MVGLRNGNLKKAIAWVIALAMVMTCGAFNVTVANAVRGQDKPAKGEKSTAYEPGEYKDGEVLVMYSDMEKMNRKDAGEVLSAAAAEQPSIKGFTVKQVWSFDMEENSDASFSAQGGAQSSAQSKSAGKSGDSFANVGLLDTGGMSVDKAIDVLKKDDSILYAEPNFRIHADTVSGVNDPYIDRQWGLDDVNVGCAWDKAKDTEYGVVAVVDTGVDYTHEDLKDNIWNNPYISKGLKGEHGFNFVNGTKEPMDDNGHGSHCAGIIAAAGNNKKGICGIAGADGKGETRNNLDIMALKILDGEGYGYGSEEIAAYNYINKAIDLGTNIVAINNSYGGSEYSEIMEKLITVVGEKGAISVMAAGNDGIDVDEYYEQMEGKLYPVEYETNYKIVVAATKIGDDGRSQELASYSNYNKEKVDLAAPGTDILSTVCYDSYNPELYSAESGINNDAFVNGVNIEKFTRGEGVTLENCKGINGSDTGIKFIVKDADKDVYAACVEYTLDKTEFKDAPNASMVVRSDVAPNGGLFGAGYFDIFDTPASVQIENMSLDTIAEYEQDYYTISGSADYWSHLTTKCCSDFDNDSEEASDENKYERKLWIVLEEPDKGDYELCIDNLGVSNADQLNNYGKYDYYSGTSMACPQVTGATAMLNLAQKKDAEEYDPLDVIGQVVSSTRPESKLKNKVASAGTLDFSMERDIKTLVLSKVKAGKGTITINGTGFDKFDSFQVIIGGEIVDESKIESVKKTEIVIKDKDTRWINDLADIEVIGTYGSETKSAVKKNVYLTDDKKEFSKPEYMDYGTTGLATNGKYLYTTSSSEDSVLVMKTSKGTDQDEVVKIDSNNMEKWFKTYDEESLSDHDFLFGDELVYMNGKLYTFGNYAEIGDNFSGVYDDWSAALSEEEYDEETITRENVDFEYFKESVLLKVNPSAKSVSRIKLPKGLEDIQDYTMAAYNGKLYIMGGFKYEVTEAQGKKPVVNGSFNRDVYIYSPSTSKWTVKAGAFPADRAGGKAVQTGKYLVYTLGYGSKNIQNNIVFNGKSWTEKTAELEPYIPAEPVSRCGNEYEKYSCGIGICKGGIVYSGLNVKDYGDTFTYNPSKDSFKDTGYNFRKYIPESVDCKSIAAGSKVYNIAYDEEDGDIAISSAKAVSSGLFKVTTSKKGKGSVTASKPYIPGSVAKVKAKAKKGYYISQIKVGGKTYKYGKKTKTKTVTAGKALVKNVTVRVVFKKR